jgi:hypothetical protein
MVMVPAPSYPLVGKETDALSTQVPLLPVPMTVVLEPDVVLVAWTGLHM